MLKRQPIALQRLRTTRIALACALVGAAIVFIAPAHAEEEESIDTKLFGGILKGLGLRDSSPDIQYRERSPLVIPPGRNLPAPEATSAKQNPNWPVDPEIKRAKAEKDANKNRSGFATDQILDQQRVLRPDELKRGTRTGPGLESADRSGRDPGRPLSPSEMGAKPGFFGSIFGSKEEAAPFTGEPPRTSLIEPPAGYQTPSPSQPYGVGKEKDVVRIPTLTDRMEGR